jgi:DNA-binding PadR family transcriptional regulator
MQHDPDDRPHGHTHRHGPHGRGPHRGEHGGWHDARHRGAHDDQHGGRHDHHGPQHRHGGRRGGRPFDYGELRLLVLALVADGPRHGYELMKEIEERMSGSYSPSPGVIYPTLAWLEDMGYASADPEPGGRKRYTVTTEGGAFLVANRAALDGLLGRLARPGAGPPPGIPDPILRGMENLKLALRLRLRQGPADPATIETIAAALDAAARAVEKS